MSDPVPYHTMTLLPTGPSTWLWGQVTAFQPGSSQVHLREILYTLLSSPFTEYLYRLPPNYIHIYFFPLNTISPSCSCSLFGCRGTAAKAVTRLLRGILSPRAPRLGRLHLPKEEKSSAARIGLGLDEGAPGAIAGPGARARSVCGVGRVGDRELSGGFLESA